ncbi:MAG: hypothetical protein WB473_11850, partial [Pedococcus sp.]
MSDERPPTSDQPGHESGPQGGETAHPATAPTEPSETIWDPWAPPRDGGAAQVEPTPGQDPTPQLDPAQHDAAWQRDQAHHHDHTQPVDLSHTQEIARPPAQVPV